MNYADYVKGINFRYLKPDADPKGFGRLSKLARKFGVSLEIKNTTLPDDEPRMRERIGKICRMPKMSTFAIGAMINYGISQMAEDECFVNVGVWHGFTFLSGITGNPGKKCIGVDNFSEFGGPRDEFLERFEKCKGPNHFFFDCDYAEYFSKMHKDPIGFYIYDGDHAYEHQLKGLEIAEEFFADDCIILVDDTNAPGPRDGTLDFIKNSSHNYRMIIDETTSHIGHPTLWNGVMIFQKTA